MSEQYPEDTFIGSLRKARTVFGMALIRIGAEIVMKNSSKYNLYVKHNGKIELLGELEKRRNG